MSKEHKAKEKKDDDKSEFIIPAYILRNLEKYYKLPIFLAPEITFKKVKAKPYELNSVETILQKLKYIRETLKVSFNSYVSDNDVIAYRTSSDKHILENVVLKYLEMIGCLSETTRESEFEKIKSGFKKNQGIAGEPMNWDSKAIEKVSKFLKKMAKQSPLMEIGDDNNRACLRLIVKSIVYQNSELDGLSKNKRVGQFASKLGVSVKMYNKEMKDGKIEFVLHNGSIPMMMCLQKCEKCYLILYHRGEMNEKMLEELSKQVTSIAQKEKATLTNICDSLIDYISKPKIDDHEVLSNIKKNVACSVYGDSAQVKK